MNRVTMWFHIYSLHFFFKDSNVQVWNVCLLLEHIYTFKKRHFLGMWANNFNIAITARARSSKSKSTDEGRFNGVRDTANSRRCHWEGSIYFKGEVGVEKTDGVEEERFFCHRKHNAQRLIREVKQHGTFEGEKTVALISCLDKCRGKECGLLSSVSE